MARTRRLLGTMLVAGILAAVAATAFASEGGEPWYRLYEEGLRLVEQGRGAEATPKLEAALRLRPDPELKAPTDGLRYIDYLPHLYLAVAAHMAGEIEVARRHLEDAERAGVAPESDVGRTLLAAMRVLLGEATPDELEGTTAPAPAVERPSLTSYPRGEEVLSDEEVARIERGVRDRCGIPSDIDPSGAPWYFFYEMALTLAERGDPQRALDALEAATDRRPDARHGARMYGMWFIDYLPYFQIARAHAALGNWECAFDALRLSESMGEVSPADDEYPDLEELRHRIEVNR